VPHQILSTDEIVANLATFDEKRSKINNIAKSTTGVVGLELVRQDLENALKLAANVDTPLRNRISRKKGNGKAHAYYKLVSNAGLNQTTSKFLGTDPSAGFFAKGGLPNSVDPQYEYIARPYANLGDTVTIPWQDKAQDESYIDIKSQQRDVKMINVGLMEEWAIINGDSAASGGLIFDGLLTQIQNDGFNILDLSAGGGSGMKYSSFVQECFTIKKAGGKVRALVMSYATKQALTELLGLYYAIRQISNTSNGEFTGGFQVDSWNFGTGSVDLIDDQYMLPDPVTGYEQIMFIDDATTDDKNSGNVIEMVDVDALHYNELMAIQTADRGIVYETSMLQVGITQYQGLLKGLNLSIPSTLS
jgi:hypothetical protein